MERKRWYACAAKRRYRSEHEALRASEKARAARGHVTRVYGPCRWCGGGFHLTSKGV